MENYKIISKVNYSHNQKNACVLLKQFLIAESNGQKILLLKMQNNFSQRLNSVKYKVHQLTAKGEEIKSFDFYYSDFQVSPNAVFVPYKSIVLEKQCVDIKVELIQANFENYSYNLDENFDDGSTIKSKAEVNKVETDFYINERKPKTPKLLTVFSTLFFVGLAIVTYFTIEEYKNTHYEFSINDFEYRLIDSEFSTDGDIVLTKYKGRARNIKIPNKILEHYVIGIEEEAFSGTSIENVVIETELETFPIGDSAFKGCKKLKSVTLGNVDEIGDYAFANCESLKELKSDKIVNIGDEAFANSGLQSIYLNGSSNLNLGKSVFKSCQYLKSVEIVQFIEFNNNNYSFLDGCVGVEKLSIVNNALDSKSQSYSVSSMFNHQTPNLMELNIDVVNSISEGFCQNMPIEKLTIKKLNSNVIGDYAFSNCSKLYSLSLPTVIKEVGAYAFANTNISKFDFNKLDSIGEFAFTGTAIDSVDLNKSIDKLPKGVFANCSNLTKITLQGQIKEISDKLFMNCSSLDSLGFDTKSIESIGSDAFAGCSLLYSLDLGENLNYIGENAFNGCSSLIAINIPSKIQKINDKIFANCTSLQNVVIEDNSEITSIGQSAFANCASLEEISFDSVDYLTDIGSYAFSGCSSLKRISLPKINTGTLPEGIFYNCSGLDSFEISSEIAYVGKSAFENCVKITRFIFGSNLSSIDSRAFANCLSLQEIKIPQSLNHLGENVFEGCENVSTLEIPFAANDYYSRSSMRYLFGGSSNVKKTLKEVYLTSVSALDDNAFEGYEALQSISLSDDLSSIGNNAFRNCKHLRKVVIGSNTEYLSEAIFKGCESIEELELPFIGYSVDQPFTLSQLFDSNGFGVENSTLKSIKLTNVRTLSDNAFSYFTALESIELSDTLTSIGQYAFYHCSALESITLPKDVEIINMNIFEGCSSLQDISIPYVGYSRYSTGTLNYLFGYDNARKLNKIELNNVNMIGYETFNGWEINEIILSDSLRTIDSYAFRNIKGLKSITIPSDVSQMGTNIFYECYDLESLTIPYVGSSRNFSCSFADLVDWDHSKYSIKNIEITNAKSLSSSVFSGWAKIQTVKLNEGISKIPNYAFQSCYSLYEINIPSSVTSIGNSAFESCYQLNEIRIPNKVSSIGSYAFSGCETLYTVYNDSNLYITKGSYDFGHVALYAYEVLSGLEQSSLQYYEDDDFKFVCLDNQWKLIKCFIEDANISFLESFTYDNNEVPVNRYSIAKGILRGRNDIENITIPGSVNEIGEYAFADMSSLNKVTFDSNSNLTYIPYYAFANNPMLETVNLPEGIETVESYAFNNCSNLKSFTIPASVKNINYYAFENCTNLFDVLNLSNLKVEKGSTEHGGVALNAMLVRTSKTQTPIKYKTINEFTYAYSDDMLVLYKYQPNYESQNVTLPSSVKIDDVTYTSYSLHNKVFYNTSIYSIHIPDAVTKIGNYCFSSCYNLHSVTFGENTELDEIGMGAFSNCNNLNEFGKLKGLRKIGDDAFNWCIRLKDFDMPSNVEYIGNNAFYYCNSLRKIVLPENLSTIGYSAFFECVKLYEVVDLSVNLDIQKGSTDHGYVGYYALVVNTSLSQEGVQYLTYDNFEFLHYDNETILTSYNDTEWVEEVKLPEKITVNGKVVDNYKIGQEAFKNKNFVKVNIPSSVTEIGKYAFDGCYSLQEVEFAKDSKLIIIDEFAFSNCNYLKSMIIPSTVSSINSNAFYNCYGLVDLVIGENVQSIGSDAFNRCNSLINVYNYSSINITKGSSEYGQVAKKAWNVYGKETSYTKTDVYNDGGNVFAKVNNDWYLLSYNYYSEIYNFPTEFYFDGNYVNEYIVSNDMFIEAYYLQQVFISKSVKEIMRNAFANCTSLKTIYYLGSEEQWNNLKVDDPSITSKTIYYYSDCIHYEGQWNYDYFGNVNTSLSSDIFWTINKEATCTEEGNETGYCSVCSKTIERTLPKTNHIYEDGKCSQCGIKYVLANPTTFAEIFTNDTNYPFKISSANIISSSLKTDSQMATLTHIATEDETIQFEYRVSSEQNCDRLLIYLVHGGVENLLIEASGEVNYTYTEILLSKGDSLKIVYSKDGSSSSGLDRCYIKNFVIM